MLSALTASITAPGHPAPRDPAAHRDRGLRRAVGGPDEAGGPQGVGPCPPAGGEGGAAGHGGAERPGGGGASHHRRGAHAYTLELLGKMLNLPAPPKRMESFDISNTGRSDIVASMVVYSCTRPLKSAYRRFRIQSLEGHHGRLRLHAGGACAAGSSGRRTGDEKFLPLPDVFLIDGGETHARAAQTVAREFGVDVPIFGMVKDDRHRTRALVTPEGREIGIVTQQAVFSLIGQIQEEDPPVRHHLPPREHSKSATRSALDGHPRRGPQAAGGAAQALRHHQGHPGGGCGDPGRRGCPGPQPRRCGTTSTRRVIRPDRAPPDRPARTANPNPHPTKLPSV